ncbi:flagellar hook protein FlgE [Zobellella denitrificans]|jgi:flagellar hook protein FlgE
MSFNIALSGVNAAQKDLDVTANNIANVNTVGFKESRAEFADVYANSIFANSRTQHGQGVQTVAVAQQFHQGTLMFTNNALDMAINGSGFFVMANETDTLDRTYTRAGAFKLNDEGYVVNSMGRYLQVFDANENGTPTVLALNATKPLRIPDKTGEPRATTAVNTGFNLPSNAGIMDPADFSPTDSRTYNASTAITIYDSLGEPHSLNMYFVKEADGQWQSFTYVDGNLVQQGGNDSAPIEFDASGNMTTPAAPATLTLDNITFANGAQPIANMEIRLGTVSQYASPFEVNELSQNGSTVGRLTKVDVDANGVVAATYSNGRTEKLGIVALATFPNEQGLIPDGDSQWRQSLLSGEGVGGQPNTGSYGRLNGAALEQSNTNLTSELVDLITAQRNFQANSRALEVNSTLQQTILQIR